jgi:hypothetical protein
MRTPFGARTVLSNTRGLSSNGTSGLKSCCVACWATAETVHVNTTSNTHDPVRVILAALSRAWRYAEPERHTSRPAYSNARNSGAG